MFSLLAHLEESRIGNQHEVLGWQPRNDVIVVLPLIEADRTQGGIIIAEEHRERPQKGVVLAVGPGMWDQERLRVLPVEAQVGDLVIYGKYSGSTFELAENLHVLMMRNVEFLARRQWGTYELVEHIADEATTRERLVYHAPGMQCEYCQQDTRTPEYRRAVAFETPAERDARWERVNIERARAEIAKAEQARQAEADKAVTPPEETTSDLVAQERARLARQSFADDAPVISPEAETPA